MRVVVPYTTIDPKSRLSPVLSADERRAFARVMLDDVLETVDAAGYRAEVLATEPIHAPDVPVDVDERPLSVAVNAMLDPPMAVVMADLALLTPEALRESIERPGDVVVGPGRGGGTNLLAVRKPFEVDFHGNSLADHRRIAAAADLSWDEVDSFRISTDVDEPADLVEVLLHAPGSAPDWLRTHGFSLTTTAGRVAVRRD